MQIEQIERMKRKLDFLSILKIFVTLDAIIVICVVTLGYHNEGWVRYGVPFVYKLLYFAEDGKLVRWSLLILPIIACVAVWKPSPIGYYYLRAIFCMEIVRCILAMPKIWYTLMIVERSKWIYELTFIPVIVAFWIAWQFMSPKRGMQIRTWFKVKKGNGTILSAAVVAVCIFILQMAMMQVDGRVSSERKTVEMQSRGISVHQLEGYVDVIDQIEAISPDGKQFAVANTFSMELDIYDMNTLKKIKGIKTRLPIRSAGYSPDGRYIAIGFTAASYGRQRAKEHDPKIEEEPGNFMIYDLEEEKRLDGFLLTTEGRNEEQQKKIVEKKDVSVEQMEFSSDGKYLAVNGMLGSEIWNVETGAIIKYPPNIQSGWPTVHWLDKTKYIRYGRMGGKGVYSGEIGGREEEEEIIKVEKLNLVKISPSKKYMMIDKSIGKNIMSVIDMRSKKEIFEQDLGRKSIRGIAFSPDEKYLAVGYDHNIGDKQEKKILIYEIDSGKLQKEINLENSIKDDIFYRPDGKTLMFCSYTNLIVVDVTK